MKTLCECGSCQSAYDRALKIVDIMYNDDECPVYQYAVGRCLTMMGLYGLGELIRYRAKQDGIELDLMSTFASAVHNKNTIDDYMGEFLAGQGTAGPKDIMPMFDRMMARIKADFEATHKDDPNIGKPK